MERKTDDLSAMRQDWPEVVERVVRMGIKTFGVSLADHYQVTGDGSRGDEEDAIGEVFGGEQGPLTEGLLAKVEDSGLAKAGGAVLLKQEVVDLAAVESETDGLFFTVGNGEKLAEAGSSAATATSEIFPGAGSVDWAARKGK